MYGQGQFGLALTTIAYERKIVGRYDPDVLRDDDAAPRDVFYPDWWQDELGIPDMEGRGVKFAPSIFRRPSVSQRIFPAAELPPERDLQEDDGEPEGIGNE